MKYYKDKYFKVEFSYFEIAILDRLLEIALQNLQHNPKHFDHEFFSGRNLEDLQLLFLGLEKKMEG